MVDPQLASNRSSTAFVVNPSVPSRTSSTYTIESAILIGLLATHREEKSNHFRHFCYLLEI